MTQTSFCLGTICNVAHTKNLWHSTEINVFVHSSCFFNDETPMAQRYKKKCRREEINDDFLFEGISATGKKTGGTSLSLQFPILIPFRQWLIDYFFTLP
jgi:hypothetical protein